MAFGSGATDSNKKFYFVKIKGLTKDDEKDGGVYLEFSTKKEGSEKTILPKQKFLSGYLVKGEIGSYIPKGETKSRRIFKLHFDDEGDRYILETAYTRQSRNLINSLAGETEYGLIKISVFVSKGYNSISVQNNGNRTNWKFQPDELKSKVDKITNKKGEFLQNDYEELDNFLEQVLITEIIPKINPTGAPKTFIPVKSEVEAGEFDTEDFLKHVPIEVPEHAKVPAKKVAKNDPLPF